MTHTSKYRELYIKYISEYSFHTIKNLPLQMSDVHMSGLLQLINQLPRWKTCAKSFGERAICMPVCLCVVGEVHVMWNACGGPRKTSGFGLCFPPCLEADSMLFGTVYTRMSGSQLLAIPLPVALNLLLLCWGYRCIQWLLGFMLFQEFKLGPSHLYPEHVYSQNHCPSPSLGNSRQGLHPWPCPQPL